MCYSALVLAWLQASVECKQIWDWISRVLKGSWLVFRCCEVLFMLMHQKNTSSKGPSFMLEPSWSFHVCSGTSACSRLPHFR